MRLAAQSTVGKPVVAWPLLAAVAAALALLGAGCATPTLPLPPPSALSSPPSADGIVTVTGNVLDGAFVSLLNERTERGVIGRADEVGQFELQIPAMVGDSLTIWQHEGTERGPGQHIIVPAAR